ncbi:hypothetical protein [Mesorhizobium sp. L103C105A0]|uniref:hypothetical protein n=1 Tax=Mesorhizobium sp. L103C105A0 TaxID=1287074 RepID=UPI0003D00F73|nr:hypothetical protein [Mesorhizobium sp. L103C105A0]ESZ76500.1 hypothetical protein X726_14105 [Mesorhizobium sp. L103C105A0]
MDAWSLRAFTRAEAAALCGQNVKSIDLLIHRAKTASALFCEKRGSRRMFSLQDICVLRVAFELERAGRTWLTALGAAFDNLQIPPDPDALLIAPAVIKRGCGLPFISFVAPSAFDRSIIVVPIGLICQQILEEAQYVAV